MFEIFSFLHFASIYRDHFEETMGEFQSGSVAWKLSTITTA